MIALMNGEEHVLSYIACAVLIGMFAIAITTDYRGQKIKNMLTFPLIISGILFVVITDQSLLIIAYSAVSFGIGIVGWLLRLWRAGDVKLIVASSIWATLLIESHVFLFVFLYYLLFLFTYLVIGHFRGLRTYRFNVKKYLLSFRTGINENYGKMIGSLVISISFVAALLINNMLYVSIS